jgi:sulfur-oxidizing protein SoxY
MEDTIMNRRLFLKRTLASALAAIFAPALLRPSRVLAAWPQEAFLKQDATLAWRALAGNTEAQMSPRVMLDTPANVGSGALVRVGVATDLDDVQGITLISEPNPFPLVANFRLSPRVRGPIVMRIRMGGSGNVVAIVSAGGRYFRAQNTVQVAAGGC